MTDDQITILPDLSLSPDADAQAKAYWIAHVNARNAAIAAQQAEDDRADQRAQRAAQTAAMQAHAAEMGKVATSDEKRLATSTAHSRALAVYEMVKEYVANGITPALAISRAWEAWDKVAAESMRRAEAGKP